MGLASSQARLLNLTSRMHQIEYKAAKLEAEKLQMANESRRVYLEYQEALEQSKIQIKTIQTDASATYVDITDLGMMINSGFTLVVHDVPYNETTKKPDSTSNTRKDVVCIGTGTGNELATSSKNLLLDAIGAKYPNSSISSSSSVDFKTLLINIMNMGDVSIVQKRTKETTEPNAPSGSNPTHAVGTWPQEGDFDYTDWVSSVATNTSFQEVDDEKALRKAEAKYEADMRRIDMKDRKFDYDLAALDAERNAVKQEMETLKTVAKDNVDRTFKLFS